MPIYNGKPQPDKKEPAKKGRPKKTSHSSPVDSIAAEKYHAWHPRIQTGDTTPADAPIESEPIETLPIVSERRADGTFQPGHSVTRWNSPSPPSLTTKYQEAFEKAVTTEDWIAVIQKAMEQAKDGVASARDWLSKYLAVPIEKIVTQHTQKEKVTINIVNTSAPIPDDNRPFFDVTSTDAS